MSKHSSLLLISWVTWCVSSSLKNCQGMISRPSLPFNMTKEGGDVHEYRKTVFNSIERASRLPNLGAGYSQRYPFRLIPIVSP
jgi:hypothetical protein